jgi:7,8-dihydropterin-6-yl-methyl-4-(beta-D-ribofuranosyl)aminobenzene 5'-phosphate synthase
MKELNSVRVTTLVENDVWKTGLTFSWGISLYVETYKGEERHTVLMDTSGSFATLSNNASKLDMKLSGVEAVFISHWHGDHCGSLSHVLPLLRRSTPVYVPSENSSGIRKIKEAGGAPMICSEPIEFMEGVISTGEIGGWTSEHSLLTNVKDKGLVILTGCGHPGIVNIVKRAQQVSGVSRALAVIGGFHISVREALETADLLRKIGAELVSPCHCTSGNVKRVLSDKLGKRCVKNGSGKIFLFE